MSRKSAAASRGVVQTPNPALSTSALLSDAPQLGALTDAKILMVDDEETTIDVLEASLQDAGYTSFIKTFDSREALALITVERPDVVLLDLNMPHVGGFEILQQLRADETLKHTPVVILTSSTDAETKLKALELGATDFLGKPVDPSELALRLRNTLAAKAYQNRLRLHDALTDLPNRRALMDELEKVLNREDSQEGFAVLHVNIDRFKQINDALGRRVGDALIKGVGGRLERCLQPADGEKSRVPGTDEGLVARVGGDEFVVILPGEGVDGASRFVRRILARMARPFRLQGDDLFVTCSIGVALFPDDGDCVDSLLSHSEIAMSHAKQNGRNTYRFYAKSLNAEALDRLHLENQLRSALEKKDLRLYYQPKLDVQTGDIVGAEALMRWQHAEMGFVPPSRFIPVAEEAGLIEPIGSWTLAAACRRARTWMETAPEPVRMSVNVSSPQVQRGNLVSVVEEALDQSGLDPQYLVLELTESMLMENAEQSAKLLHRLRKMGVRISIDDFGTGYSSLAYLKRFPLDELKIDRSFVKGVPDDSDDAAIVTAIIAMAHSLGLKVVAEGVETPEQLEFLAERGCNEYQGFLFSKAIPASDWKALLLKERERRAKAR